MELKNCKLPGKNTKALLMVFFPGNKQDVCKKSCFTKEETKPFKNDPFVN